MNPEPQQATLIHDVELPGACPACGGPLLARFTPGSARGACLRCHALCALAVTQQGDRLAVVPLPSGLV
jgi:hypothetical protein